MTASSVIGPDRAPGSHKPTIPCHLESLQCRPFRALSGDLGVAAGHMKAVIMKRLGAIVFVAAVISVSAIAQAQDAISVESMPPVVVKTFPQSGDTEVDPSIREICVTFSKDMMTNNMWSWVIHTRDTFLEVVGDVKYLDDKRTCVAPVRLEPGKTYAIWFNSPNYRHNAFRDTQNNPVVPYLPVFRTSE